MSADTPQHGATGCPCEDCLDARIQFAVDAAGLGGDPQGLRARLDGLRACVGAPETARSLP